MVVKLREMSLEQRRQFIDTEQLWEAWLQTNRRSQSYSGSMGWRTSKGREYLVRQLVEGQTRQMRSLGPRSTETERLLEEFRDNKAGVKADRDQQASRLSEMARLNRALRLGRVPRTSAAVLRALERRQLLGRSVSVIGTHAIFAYEARAGLFVDTDILATGDLDILYDARARLRLRAEEDPPSLRDALELADKTFKKVEDRSFRAVNSAGFYVDLIKATPHDVMTSTEKDAIGGADDLHACHIENMRWVVNAPKFKSMAIGEDGYPVSMVCPDPRAFALYKLWMSLKDPSREPLKRKRDSAQATTVAAIVNHYMPDLPFEPQHLASFPIAASSLAEEHDFFRLVA
jgi:hypothetical protein